MAANKSIDYFLEIDGIEGESTDSTHAGQIQVLTFQWGQSQPTNLCWGTGGGAGKVSMQDLTFNMYTCKASAKLFLACAKGTHVKYANLTARKAGGSQEDFYRIKLDDVLVSSFNVNGGGGDELPVEAVTLAFAKISYQYRPQKDDGTLDTPLRGGWDLQANKAS